MVAVMRISEMYEKDVFTDAGKYFGKVSDVVLGKFMIHGWVIKATPQSMLRESLGDVRAVVVPHKAVRAISDVVIISQNIEIGKGGPEEIEEENPEGAHSPETPQPEEPTPSPFRF